MENLFWIGLVGAFIALSFAFIQSRRVFKFDEGTDKMKQISMAIRKGAGAYLKRQYKTVAIIFVFIAIILALLAFIHGWATDRASCPNSCRLLFLPAASTPASQALSDEDRHSGQRPYGFRGQPIAEPRPSRRHFLWLCNGLHRCRTGDTRRIRLVPHTQVRF